jgi:hypothetical protein
MLIKYLTIETLNNHHGMLLIGKYLLDHIREG